MKKYWKSLINWFLKYKRVILITFLLLIVIGSIYYVKKPDKPTEVPFQEFIEMVEKDKIKEVDINLTAPTFKFIDKEKHLYKTDNPKDETFKKYLLEENIKVNEVKQSVLLQILLFMVKILAMLLLLKIVMDSVGGKNVAQLDKATPNVPKLKFESIAGNEEAKEDMKFLVEFLKNPKKFNDKGAKLPKGVVFYGPPGTGKTLMAKAIAGEAEVPFIYISGSDFIEMYVGLGAKRVRNLFKMARKKSPCIIFIDEIDAVGTKRGNGNDSEKDQTINALLNELDGFNGSEGIIVITATNRIEELDSALIRPGRFDKHISISSPTLKDRVEILKLHAKNKVIDESVDFESLAKVTMGFAGAGLEALINEATILSVTRNHDKVLQEDLDDAYYKIVMKGHKRKNKNNRNEDELKLVAWHEAGHALVAKLLAGNDVPKVTITASTNGAGGVTFITPKKTSLLSKTDLLNEIKTLYAGRIGELLLLGDKEEITTGASKDINQATECINDYIDKFGMSEKFGMINPSMLIGVDNHNFILSEAMSLSAKLYEETLQFMTEHKKLLESIANVLLVNETISENELELLIKQHEEDSMI